MELRSGRRLSSLPPRKRNKSLNRRSNHRTGRPSLDIGRDEDRISTLSDHLLLGILERVDLPSAVRAGAVSTRWQHLPHQLSHLHLDVGHFPGATPLETMDAFTGAMRRLLSTCSPAADCNSSRAIKTLILSFYMSSTHLCSIGRAVEDVVTHSATERLDFNISLPSGNKTRLPSSAPAGSPFDVSRVKMAMGLETRVPADFYLIRKRGWVIFYPRGAARGYIIKPGMFHGFKPV